MLHLATSSGGVGDDRRVRESRTDLRRALRADVQAPATYIRPSVADPIVGAGTGAGFSGFGVRIDHATAAVKPGDQLELHFSLFPGSHSTVFYGRVVWEKADRFAIEFVNLEPHHLRVLELVMRRP